MLVDSAGQELHETAGEDGMYAVRGVPGGLAVRDENATLRRYDVATGEIEDYVGDQEAQIGDVTVDRVAWCEQACEPLDGRQFFYRTMPGASAPARLKVLGRYAVDTETFEQVPLDTGIVPAHGVIALPGEALPGLFR